MFGGTPIVYTNSKSGSRLLRRLVLLCLRRCRGGCWLALQRRQALHQVCGGWAARGVWVQAQLNQLIHLRGGSIQWSGRTLLCSTASTTACPAPSTPALLAYLHGRLLRHAQRAAAASAGVLACRRRVARRGCWDGGRDLVASRQHCKAGDMPCSDAPALSVPAPAHPPVQMTCSRTAKEKMSTACVHCVPSSSSGAICGRGGRARRCGGQAGCPWEALARSVGALVCCPPPRPATDIRSDSHTPRCRSAPP